MTGSVRRQLVIVIALGVAVALLAVIYYQVTVTARRTMVGWVVTHDVKAGDMLQAGRDLATVSVPVGGGDFRILDQSPVGHRASHALLGQSLLGRGDVLADDLVEVAETVTGGSTASLAPGDQLDLYAVVGGTTVLVGRHVPVAATGAGGEVVLLVPIQESPSWVTVSANGKSLSAVKVRGDVSADAQPLTLDDALRSLAGQVPIPHATRGPRS